MGSSFPSYLAGPGIPKLLSYLIKSGTPVKEEEFLELANSYSVEDSELFLSHLVRDGYLIASPGGFYVGGAGKRVGILIQALADSITIEEAIQRLQELHPNSRPYELLTGGLTEKFVDSLQNQPDFIRLHICSPWVRLKAPLRNQFISAFASAERQYSGRIEVEIVMRPIRGDDPWSLQLKETFDFFSSLGASIYTNRKVHAKLFMRQPGPNGGVQSAILGSENLTGARNLELGIRIKNDNLILRKLGGWFRDVQLASKFLGG